MPITRTIYTQGKVTLKTGALGALTNFAVVSGVQNASFSMETPRENVNSFGFKGLVDKVQVAPETASISFTYVLPKNDIVDNNGNALDTYGANANHLSPSKISGLMGDALADTHSGVHVEIAGIGCLISGVMSSFSVNASAGELATVDMTFEGIPSGGSTGQDTDAELPAKNSSIGTATYEVLTPDRISGYLPDNSLGNDGGAEGDLIKTLYTSDFSVNDNSFAIGVGTLTAGVTPANKDGSWLEIKNAALNLVQLSKASLPVAGTNLDNYTISFRIYNNNSTTIFANAALDDASALGEFSASAISIAQGEDKVISFSSKLFNTNDLLLIRFGSVAGGVNGPTGDLNLSADYIYIKDIVVSTDGGPNNAGNFAGCVQSATFSWEVPIERIQCLGEPVTNSTNFSNPPGSSSLTLEGIDIPYPVSGITLGDMRIMLRNAKVVSREHNLAVGDIAATFNLSLEATAMDVSMFPTLTNN